MLLSILGVGKVVKSCFDLGFLIETMVSAESVERFDVSEVNWEISCFTFRSLISGAGSSSGCGIISSLWPWNVSGESCRVVTPITMSWKLDTV